MLALLALPTFSVSQAFADSGPGSGGDDQAVRDDSSGPGCGDDDDD